MAQNSSSLRAAAIALTRSPPNSMRAASRHASSSPTSTIHPRPQQIFDATEGAGLVVDILINNAGLGQFGSFVTSDADQEFSMVRVNCEAVVRLSRLFLPPMVERRRGWMLVVASAASFQPVTISPPTRPPRHSTASSRSVSEQKSPASA